MCEFRSQPTEDFFFDGYYGATVEIYGENFWRKSDGSAGLALIDTTVANLTNGEIVIPSDKMYFTVAVDYDSVITINPALASSGVPPISELDLTEAGYLMTYPFESGAMWLWCPGSGPLTWPCPYPIDTVIMNRVCGEASDCSQDRDCGNGFSLCALPTIIREDGQIGQTSTVGTCGN